MKKHKNKAKYILWAIVILWMVFILSLSSQISKQSNEQSKGVAILIAKTVRMILPDAEIDIDLLNFYTRKGSHFFAFFLLGILTIKALRKSGINIIQSALISLLICISFAVIDETFQLFIPGRGGRIADVFLDSAGGLTGILLFLLITCPKPLKAIVVKNSLKPIHENN